MRRRVRWAIKNPPRYEVTGYGDGWLIGWGVDSDEGIIYSAGIIEDDMGFAHLIYVGDIQFMDGKVTNAGQ